MRFGSVSHVFMDRVRLHRLQQVVEHTEDYVLLEQ